MPEVEKFDVKKFLLPIPGDSAVGIDIKEEGRDVVASLVRLGQWEKVRPKCTDLLLTTTKDLTIAVYLAESLAKLDGLDGLNHGLVILMGLIEQYWTQMYPKNEQDDHPQPSIWLGKFDTFAEQMIRVETPLTISFEGKNYSLWEWQNCERVVREIKTALRNTEQSKERERAAAKKEKPNAEAALAQLTRTVSATNSNFYARMSASLQKCSESAEQFARVLDEKYGLDKTIDTKEYPAPHFKLLRGALEECAAIATGTLAEKEPAVESSDPLVSVTDQEASGEHIGIASQLGSRDDAIRQLKRIAAFFQATEPHSPIAYLVLRAARWGELSLEDWLDEVVKEPAVLGKIRETLGIQAKPKTENPK